MPTLATGNNASTDRPGEAGFSLVEVLAVLAILSLMVGVVVMNLPEPRSETDRASEAMAGQLDRFLDDGGVAGEMRGLGPYEGGLVLFRHDGVRWTEAAEIGWPEDARVTLALAGERTDLPETARPILLFEPYAGVPDFTLSLEDRQADYRLSVDPQGQVIRTIER